MPSFVPPRNDNGRLAFLQRTQTTGAADHAAGAAYLSVDMLAAVNVLATQFAAAVSSISSSQSERSRQIRQRQEALAELEVHVRDLWAGLRRRVRRQKLPAEVLTLYNLPLDGISPHPTRQYHWLAIAAGIVSGDAQAVAAGYSPMANPSAAEVDAVLTAAHAEATEADAADRIFDQAQEAMAELRIQANQMIEDVMAELRFTLRRKEKASQRRIMRTYGATFDYQDGEPHDLDDQTEPEPEGKTV